MAEDPEEYKMWTGAMLVGIGLIIILTYGLFA